MNRLPQVSGSEVVRALQKIGFSVRRQHGSHIILRRDMPFAQTVVPNHRQIDRGELCELFCARPIWASMSSRSSYNRLAPGFDPRLPADNAPIASGELRGQFTRLGES